MGRWPWLMAALGVILAACGQAPSDTAKPTVALTQPVDRQTLNTQSVTVQGTAQDNVGVTRVTYQLNGGPEQGVAITPGRNVSFSFQVTLNPGPNTLQVNAYDAAGNKGMASVEVVFGTLALTGLVVDNNAGAPVVGSTVTVDGLPAATATDSNGAFTLYLPPGTYHLNFAKPGYAGSRIENLLLLQGNLGPLKVIQKQAANPSLPTAPPQLTVTTGAGGCGNLPAGQDFSTVTQAQGCVPFRIQAQAQGAGNMIRYIYAALGKTPGSAFFTSPRFIWTADTNGPDTGNRTLSGASVAGISGPTTFEVVVYDVNENRTHRLYYLNFSQTFASPAVTPVSNFQVLAVTLAQAIGFYGPPKPAVLRLPGTEEVRLEGAPSPDSTLWVQLSWQYSGTNPDRFEVYRSFDGQNFTKIATLGGAARSYNDASPELRVGQRVYYRVDAVGQNVAPGPVLATTPLDRFTVHLLSPAKYATGVSVTPTLSWSVSQKVGDLRLFAPFLLDYPQQGEFFVWAPYSLNNGLLFSDQTLTVNGNTYSVPYNQDGSAVLPRLEAFHSYSFDLSAAAVGLDPSNPNRIEAISIAQDLWNVFHPLQACNFGGPVCTGEWNEFVTGDGSY
ncbi:carboxypeptidase regulatory-like domain-containing protein [Thermus islandicus]|uniref:carboxypeptidase regulatory-like domain-containing protein n=1 Tax=Thermus islandicus TaxID=540988 RepID=UPI0004249B75|nr:carboxypeptidase regulatory-like domain-containing protein [Thermus islandicus]